MLGLTAQQIRKVGSPSKRQSHGRSRTCSTTSAQCMPLRQAADSEVFRPVVDRNGWTKSCRQIQIFIYKQIPSSTTSLDKTAPIPQELRFARCSGNVCIVQVHFWSGAMYHTHGACSHLALKQSYSIRSLGTELRSGSVNLPWPCPNTYYGT